METEKQAEAVGEEEFAELVLFQVPECYVYKIPPRKSAASYRADEWDINKWAWEGSLRIVSKGEDCRISLEDVKTGEIFAQAPIRKDLPLPVEAVIDSSRFFVLRIEDNTVNVASRHAFIGIGFRERPQAYDFQAALYDHVKYLHKKKEAEEMEQEYRSKPSADYGLKDGETLRLQIKQPPKSSSPTIGMFSKQKHLEEMRVPPSPSTPGALGFKSVGSSADASNFPQPFVPMLAPPPAPTSTPSPSKASPTTPNSKEAMDEDFGDFQTA